MSLTLVPCCSRTWGAEGMSASCRAGEQLCMSFSPAVFSTPLLSLGSPNAPAVCAAWAQDHIRWGLFRSGQQVVPSRGRGGCMCANTLALRNDVTAFRNLKHGGGTGYSYFSKRAWVWPGRLHWYLPRALGWSWATDGSRCLWWWQQLTSREQPSTGYMPPQLLLTTTLHGANSGCSLLSPHFSDKEASSEGGALLMWEWKQVWAQTSTSRDSGGEQREE